MSTFPVLSVPNLDYLTARKSNESHHEFESNLYVVPTEIANHHQHMLDILKEHFSRRSRQDRTLWLIGTQIEKNHDAKSTIKGEFSLLDLDYDDDVFVYTVEEGEFKLYEIYKIGEDDAEITVLPFGNWLRDGKLVVDQPEKHLRRKNLMVMIN